jgi:hypothetical protein
MKDVYTQEIGDYRIITGIAESPTNPEETKSSIAKKLGIPVDQVILRPDFKQLFWAHVCYCLALPGVVRMADDEAAGIPAALDALGQYQHLLIDMHTVIVDLRGTVYWKKVSGIWTKLEIDEINQDIPIGAYAEDGGIPENIQKEIAAQMEAEGIAALSAEEKGKKKQDLLDSAADEAAHLERRAQIQGKPFDTQAWYQTKAAEIEAKYK